MRYIETALLLALITAGAAPAQGSRLAEPAVPTGCASGPEALFEISLTAEPAWGIAPFGARLEAAVTAGYEVLVNVEWDFDGDLVPDACGETVEHTFTDAVDYPVTAWITTLGHGVVTRSATVSGHTAVMSVTFDDGQQSVYTVALPILEARGLDATVYVVPTWMGGGWYLTWDQLHALQDGGWDIASHTMTHPDLTKVDSTTLHYELQQSKAELQSRGFSARHFAAPYGACSWTVIDAVRLYYESCRGWKGLNPPLEDTDPYLLKWDVTARTKPFSDYAEMMDSVAAYGGWYILNNHLVYPDCGSINICVADTTFARILDYALEHRLKILSIDQALQSLGAGETAGPPPGPRPSSAGGFALRVEQSAPAGLPAIASFTVPPGLTAEIAIYDVTGRQVRSLAAGCCPGEHRAAWDGKDCGGAGVASGLYFCVLRASDGCIAAGKVPVVR